MANKKVTINLEDGYSEYIYEEYLVADGMSREIEITTQKEDDLQECLNDKETFKLAIKRYNESIDEYNEEKNANFPKSNMTYEKFFNDNYDLILRGTAEDIIYFLNKSDIKNKKIILTEAEDYEIDIRNEAFIDKIMAGLNNVDNIYVLGDGNSKEVSLQDYKDTMEYMDKIVEKIEKLDLSPYEQLMYLFDIVRDRKYKEEKDDEDYSLSRDLTEVTKGDNIVCVGFSQIFDKAAKKLGFNTHLIDLDTKVLGKNGHYRNMVYIVDDKYGIDGIYTFDTTFNSKDDNNTYLDSYRFFAKPNTFFHGKEISRYSNRGTDDLTNAEIKIRSNKKNEVTRNELISINSLSERLLHKELFSPLEIMAFDETLDKDNFLYRYASTTDKEKIYSKIRSFYKMFTKNIPARTFMKALVKVRSLEYYENPEKYPLSEEKILEIVENSMDTKVSAEELLLRSIFGSKIPNNTPKQIIKGEELDKQIAGVQLSKTLRKVLEQKNK